MKKKIFLLMLCLLMVFAVGCGKETPTYPDMGEVETPDNAQTATYQGFSADYDGDDWVYDDLMKLFTIYDEDTYAVDSNCNNVNVVVSGEYDGPITEEDMNALIDEIKASNMEGYEIKSNELRTLNGETVIYVESEITLTDKMIDLMIGNGNVTEEQIAQIGGREVLKASGSSSQMAIYSIVDGHIVIFTGTYYEADDKDDVLEAMKLLVKTGKIS